MGLSLIQQTLIFSLFALPLIFFPYTYLSFELPKVLVFYLFSILMLGGLILGKPHSFKLNLIHLLVLLFISWLILASILGIDFEHSFWGNYFRRQGIITWIGYFIIFIASGIAFQKDHFKIQASWAVIFGALAVSILALSQFISLYFLGNLGQLLYSGRIISTFGQPNFLASFLVMSLPFFWYLQLSYIGAKKHLIAKQQSFFIAKQQSFFIILTGALVILATILTFSRSGWLALTVLLLMWGLYHWKMFLGLLTGVIILYALLANLFPLLVFREWSRFQVDLGTVWSAENRTLIAERSSELISKKPLFGYGAENFILAFPQVVESDDLGLKDIVIDSAHNLFLDIAVETGIVGLTIFILILLAVFAKGLKSLGTQKSNFTAILLVVIIVFLISHQFSPLSLVPLLLFFISAGAVAGPAFAVHPTPLAKLPTAVIFLVILVPIFFFIIQNIRADMIFKQASIFEVSDINRAIKLDNETIKIAPWVKFYVWRRDFLLRQLGISN